MELEGGAVRSIATDAPLQVHAGLLRAVLADGALTAVAVGSSVLVDAVYVAVRDADWQTIPPVVSGISVSHRPDLFRARFRVLHEQDDISFTWDGDIEATGGRIVFSMAGTALRTFASNRIGFCLLHPFTLAGRPVTVSTRQGPNALHFPALISAHQLFPEHHGMTYGAPGARLRIDLDGEVFETEDQRNWTDPSFKTYCPPLRVEYPRIVAAGEQIVQRVVLMLEQDENFQPVFPGRFRYGAQPPLPVPVDLRPRGRALPAIGFGASSQGGPLTPSETAVLQECRPAHLTVDVGPEESDDVLETAALQARALDVPLDVTLVVESADEVKAAVSALVRLDVRVARMPVFRRSTSTTDAELARAARSAVQTAGWPDIRIGGGSRANFAELNRTAPPMRDLDFVSFAVSAQVHAFDDDSVMRTLFVHELVLRQAAQIAQGRPVAVGPVTLRPRFNAVATTTGRRRNPTILPWEVDSRQPTWFTATWALGSIVGLRSADRLTYFEVAGWRGLVAREDAALAHPQFPAAPGMRFPLQMLFADLATRCGSPVAAAQLIEDGPARIVLLATAGVEGFVDVLLGNLAGRPTRLVLKPERGRVVDGQMLGEDADMEADPRTGRITLPPFRIARLTVEQAGDRVDRLRGSSGRLRPQG